AGGMALARFLLDRPGLVAGRRVLDLGAGSGLVAIAAAKAGASKVTASEIDEYALAAIRLNAEANGVAFGIVGDLLGGTPPVIDLVAVGDLFYEAGLAERVLRFLDLCIEGGAEVLIGDPGRNHLPRGRLEFIADYRVPDVGEVERGTNQASAVFRLTPPRRRRAG
ncbi:MAG: 50S ribosomal protein L11 methyltransferase, partial [Cucumibacter sp.]